MLCTLKGRDKALKRVIGLIGTIENNLKRGNGGERETTNYPKLIRKDMRKDLGRWCLNTGKSGRIKL